MKISIMTGVLLFALSSQAQAEKLLDCNFWSGPLQGFTVKRTNGKLSLNELDWRGQTHTSELTDVEWTAKKFKLRHDSSGWTNWIHFEHGLWHWNEQDSSGHPGSSATLDCD